MTRLIVWDAPDSVLQKAVESIVAGDRHLRRRLRFLPQQWADATRLGASLSRSGAPWSVRFPLRVSAERDRILIGPSLETPSQGDASAFSKRDYEYVLGERMVLLASVQHFLRVKYPACLLNPPRLNTGSVMIASPMEQRRLLRQAGFSLPRSISTNDTTRLPSSTRGYQQMEFLGMDVPTSQNPRYRRHGEPYLPRRLVRVGRMEDLHLVTVVAKQVFESSLGGADPDLAPRRVPRKNPLSRAALAAAELADTQVCEIVTTKVRQTHLGFGLTRTVGAVNLPEHLPVLLRALMRQHAGKPPRRSD